MVNCHNRNFRNMQIKTINLIFKKFNWFCFGIVFIDLCYGNISPGTDGVTSRHIFTETVVSTSASLPDPCASGLDNCTLDVANCIAKGNSYSCQCLAGYSGDGRGPNGCVDINECSLGLCHSNANCVNTVGSYSCACRSGFTGDGNVCTDIDECLNSVCDINADCNNTQGSYICTCKSGFFSENNNCYDINECTSGEHKCVSPAFCNNQIPSYSCLCPTGYTSSGQFTCQNVNECLNPTLNDCDVNSDCIDNDGSYTCQCKNGFTGDGKTCTDINECTGPVQQCDNNAQCRNTAGSFLCTCNEGYVGSGKICTDLNECSNSTTNLCIDPAICINNLGSYQCNCPAGYRKNNQFSCFDINECLSSTNCPVSSVCENTLGSFRCLCNVGFHGKDCTDLNECFNSTLNRCDANALCTNSVGSYRCQCKKGFEGDGFSCNNINECLQINNCDSAANCIDNIGSYTCSCTAGYSGDGFTCSDINECLTNRCDQQCTNIPGSYQCSCNTGYEFTAPHTCTNINECLSTSTNDCNLNALCSDTPGSYNCTCKSGYLGDGKDCVVDYFVPYKSGNFIQDADVNQPIVRLQSIDGIPVSGTLFHDIYVCVNGFISVRFNLCEEGPSGDLGTPLSDGTIFAPYWTDIDTTIPTTMVSLSNRVYYSSYEEQSNNAEAVSVKSSVQSMIQNKTSAKTFAPNYIAVITWFEVTPYPSINYFNSLKKATFQCVLTTDGINTFVYYVYYNMLWDDPFNIFKVQVGYRFNPSLSLVPNVISPYNKLRFDKAPGNVGVNGLWIFQVSNTTNNNAAIKCNQWKNSLPSSEELDAYINSRSRRMKRRMSCPCNIHQAVYDRQYKAEDFLLHFAIKCIFRKGRRRRNCPRVDGSNIYCIQRKNIWFTNLRNINGDKYAVVTRCCYESLHGGLIRTISGLPSPLTQNHLKASSLPIRTIRRNRNNFRAEAILEDLNPFRQCCINSGKCIDYISHVIIPSCEYYRAPRKCSSYGDPHIKTLDGFQYTYNGLGDYHLIYTPDLKIQGRTCLANMGKATVFCGFALTESEQPRLELYLDLGNKNVMLLVDNVQQNISSSTFGDVEVSYDNTTANPTFTFDFLSGASAEVEIFPEMLQSVVSIPDDVEYNTTGLLGTLNDNMEDDLQSFQGTIVSVNATEQEIYYKFGNTWEVAYNESLFSRNHTARNQNFVPTFFTKVSELFQNDSTIKAAESLCGNFSTNRECFFDFAVTDSPTLAVEGKSFINNADEVNHVINLEQPKVTGPILLNVTYNQRFNFAIEASSSVSTNLTYFVKTNYSTSITLLNEQTGIVQLMPSLLNETLEIGVIDEFGLSAVLQPKILYCYCLNNGKCDYSNLEYEEVYVTGIYLSFVQCICKKGFAGSRCQNEIDACEADPCFVSVSCIPEINNNSENVAVCGACPNGYTGNGRKCFDIDDCLASPCQQICTNEVGSYSCSCNSGYIKYNSTHCEDVNECNNVTVCQNTFEYCVNTVGSYECRCLDGYRRNSSDSCIDVDECHEKTDNCQQTCVNNIGGFTCACNPGFSLSSDNKTCDDINECVNQQDNCHSNASCLNTNGSFQCSCKLGFVGNGTICEDIDECNETKCSLCSNTIGSYVCSCQPGFQLSLDQVTCQAVNPCLSNTDSCDSNATCVYVASNVQCTCNGGYTGNGTTCEDINECDAQHGCQSTCTNIAGSFFCSCLSGYALNIDGKTCSDINECVFGIYSCQENSACNNTNGGYACNCNQGFEKKNSNCIDIDECKQNTSGCSQICNNTIGSFVCSCQSGYQQNTKQCININECVIDQNICHQNATCTDTIGSYSCSCKDGYIGDGKKNCQDINECNANHGCLQTCVNTGGSYHCSCRTGYTLQVDGKTCLEDNECILGTANCNTNETCFNEPEGSFTCRGLCPGNCEQLCNDTSLGYHCYCRQGYQPKSSQKNKCENINECINSKLNTCHSSAVCIDTIGSFNCQCPQGFTGDGKSLCIETTSTPYTTITPNQIKIVSGKITLYDIVLNGDPLNLDQSTGGLIAQLRDPAIVNQLNDRTSELYKNVSNAIQQALYVTYLELEVTTLSVEVLSLDPNTSPNLKVDYRVRFRDTYVTSLNVLQNELMLKLQDNQNLLSNNAIKASVIPSSVLLEDEDECSTGVHRCHSNADCTNTLHSYTCTCKNNYKGDGFTCTTSSDDTETLIAVLVSVVGGLLLLVIIITVLLVVRRRRREELGEADSVDGGGSGSSWNPHTTGKLRARSIYLPRNVVTTEFRSIPDN